MPLSVYRNPVLRGFRPDPSICFVGGDCYLVNSTFEYFPGVPVFHSRDLIRWEPVGPCLTRASQIPLQNCRPSGGIYAPTLRRHGGRFYMITTNVTGGGNFIVSAENIAGPWSEPRWIDHEGIDPSLFFDDDDRAYYCGTGLDAQGRQGIALFEIDPETGAVLSGKCMISYGFTRKCPEGPHIYKIGGWYYLMIAEGGTEYGHMETIFRSRELRGPYESCPSNPILTNRDEMGNPIQCCGHADLGQDANGNWWMVCLGIRKLPGGTMLHNLGRETFLAPVRWTPDGWPVVGDGGVIRETMEGLLPLGEAAPLSDCFSDDFEAPVLGPAWTYLRNPELRRFCSGGGKLRIDGGAASTDDFAPAFVGVRQTQFEMAASVQVAAPLAAEGAKAGITVYYSKENHYDFYLERQGGVLYAALYRRIMDLGAVTGRVALGNVRGPVTLWVRTDADAYRFSVAAGERETPVGTGCTAGLCTEATRTMTFTGTFFGLFAVETEADFSSFRLDTPKDPLQKR